MLKVICGADPWSAADALVGLYLATTDFRGLRKPARGPAADQGVRPTNPIAQLIRGRYISTTLK
jgi:hypothetical protein